MLSQSGWPRNGAVLALVYLKRPSRLLSVSLNLHLLISPAHSMKDALWWGSLGQNICSVLCLVLIDDMGMQAVSCTCRIQVQGDISFSAEPLSVSALQKGN